jgi:2-oxoacid:acceptor oxidoreductase delta subunit (pyruvate/2-ketoisovalerate family)
MSVNKGAVTSKPSSENKTGSWRSAKPVVTDKCIGCGICVDFCPEGCIVIEQKKSKIDYDYCKGCLICANVCPVKAIKEEDKK